MIERLRNTALPDFILDEAADEIEQSVKDLSDWVNVADDLRKRVAELEAEKMTRYYTSTFDLWYRMLREKNAVTRCVLRQIICNRIDRV